MLVPELSEVVYLLVKDIGNWEVQDLFEIMRRGGSLMEYVLRALRRYYEAKVTKSALVAETLRIETKARLSL
ncbi:hypothetical protein BVK86_23915 [Pseudomonas reinekei]|uniref:Uncharacterized protein n=1 Tax=Pseudomonas reinekei TaxID=395598 RepID=A0A1Q9WMM2_PSERE|nr:hypothetical protein BVK86_23915 [Pseudomonas reinekei]